MRKIFLDANIVIDYINIDSTEHETAKACVKVIRTHYGKPAVSPFTFLITTHLAGKYAKDKKWHRLQMQTLFSGFEIIAFQSTDVKLVFESQFLDLEDGLQYACALSVKADSIITKDVHDFYAAAIPFIHPLDFVQRFNDL